MRYEKYYIGNTSEHKGLFEQLRGKEAAPNRVPDGDINMINETSTNNGVTKKASSDFVFTAPAITVSVNYAQTVFLQVEDFCASVNILILKNDWLTKMPKAGLYIVTHLIKNNQKYNYSCKISKDRLNDTMLALPTLDEIDKTSPYSDEGYIPDWQFMEDYISELEQEQISELEQYLIATGLNDYELTEEEKPSLDDVRWGEFKLGELFEIKTTKSVDKNKIEFKDVASYDFIGRTSANWGVQGFVNKLDFPPNPKNSFSLVQVGETVALWRDKEWYASQNLFLLQPKVSKIKDVYLYFQAVINKEMSVYGNAYNSYPTLASLNKTYISLPVTPTGEPDWQFMEDYIRAIEKVVVKDVVKYKDDVISKTKEVIA